MKTQTLLVELEKYKSIEKELKEKVYVYFIYY
jgi:hypothetical protein